MSQSIYRGADCAEPVNGGARGAGHAESLPAEGCSTPRAILSLPVTLSAKVGGVETIDADGNGDGKTGGFFVDFDTTATLMSDGDITIDEVDDEDYGTVEFEECDYPEVRRKFADTAAAIRAANFVADPSLSTLDAPGVSVLGSIIESRISLEAFHADEAPVSMRRAECNGAIRALSSMIDRLRKVYGGGA